MGRFSGIGQAIATVADKLKKERELGMETGQKINLLGVEGLMTGKITPAAQGEAGTTFTLPGMGTFKPKPSLMENVTISPDGELAYKVGDTFIPLKSISKSGFTTATPAKPEITKTTALNIISDPVKAEQLKMTYPDVYSLIEDIAQGEVNQPFQPPKIASTEERVNVVSPTGQTGSIPKSQLEEALKSGYKRTIK